MKNALAHLSNAECLDAAADWFEHHAWYRAEGPLGPFHYEPDPDSAEGRYTATCVGLLLGRIADERNNYRHGVITAFGKYLGLPTGFGGVIMSSAIFDWNDRQPNLATVLEALRGAAQYERSKAEPRRHWWNKKVPAPTLNVVVAPNRPAEMTEQHEPTRV